MSNPEALRLSWSHLRLHDECPAKWGLQRSHPSAVKDIRNFVHGTVVDIAMRRYLGQESPQAGWMREQVDAIFEECTEHSDEGTVRWKTASDRRDTLAMCRELVTRLDPILDRYCLPFRWDEALRFSVPIMVDVPGGLREITLIGEMDLLVEDSEGRMAVWDLKATRDDAYYKKVLGQLAFYALAVRAMHGRFPVMTGLIQPMCAERVLPVTITDQAVREMAARITRTANDIWAGRLAPKAGNEGCNWCEVMRVCPKFALPTRPGRVALTRG